MALSACIISPLIFAGCATQPKLHIPSQQSNKLVIHPLNITTVAATNGSLTIGSNTNTPAGAASETNASPNYKVVAYSSSTNFVSAYIQIMADDDAAQEFGKDFSESFFVGEVAIENRNTTNSFLAYSSTLQVNIKYYISEKDWAAVSKNGNVPEGYIPSVRRPATYSDVLAIFDFQQKSNRRQQIYDYIQSAGAIAAGATMFIGGPVYPKAVSFATGIVTP